MSIVLEQLKVMVDERPDKVDAEEGERYIEFINLLSLTEESNCWHVVINLPVNA